MSWKTPEAKEEAYKPVSYTHLKEEAYKLLLLQQKALLEGETDLIANLANSSALLNQTLQDTVFAGYYLYKNDELILGPFQGNVSCVHIAMGKGVCGESAEKNQTLIVENVLEHKNYIACDSAARSEIVVPMKKGDQLIGVLDLDSSEIGMYDQIDQFYLEQYVSLLLENIG
ncbi:GAF domain-containing protein [Enterococcus sp. 3H8_DIV0648]|uniref:GAF domain-containing protein n=1 Tax=Enterococcus sp. 3H8_DIV0648 TaxID=1834178 RepID=UPI000B65D6F0|nr:GAF domain-containing protein [Enterococcus sp. 3H8_DIV0648]OTO19920.1 GAF domain-containing protein [Enterococcus sp. 3H8_DIV0648]